MSNVGHAGVGWLARYVVADCEHELTRLLGGRDPELAPEPITQPPVGDKCTGTVAAGGQACDQGSLRVLGQGIKRHPTARVCDCAGEVALRVGLRCEALQQLG